MLEKIRCMSNATCLLRLCDKHPYNFAWFLPSLTNNMSNHGYTQQKKVPLSCMHKTYSSFSYNLDNTEMASNAESTARAFFMNSVHYKKTVAVPDKTWMSISDTEISDILKKNWMNKHYQEIILALHKLSQYVSANPLVEFNQENCDPILVALERNCSHLEYHDLLNVLKCLLCLGDKLSNLRSYKQLVYSVGTVCTKRKREKKLSVQDTLLLCDLFLIIRKRFKADANFVVIAITSLCDKPQKLQPSNLVQVLYYLSIVRRSKGIKVSMYELEYRLEECLEELSIKEIGIAALAFFLTETKIKSTLLLNNIMKKMLSVIDIVDGNTTASIMKILRYSADENTISMFRILLSALILRIPKYNIQTVTHIAQACANMQVYDEDAVNVIVKTLNDRVSTARLKDIERIVWALSTFNIDNTNPVYQNIIEEITTRINTNKICELDVKDQSLVHILETLSLMNLYPQNIIQYVMNKEHIDSVIKLHNNSKRAIDFSFMRLQYNVKIECPEYKGPFLEKSIVDSLKMRFGFDKKKNEARTERILEEITQTCQQILKSETAVCTGRILPQFAMKDIIICLDEHNHPTTIQNFESPASKYEVKYIPERLDNKCMVLILGTRNHYTRGSNNPVGLLKAKMRLLKQIKYHPFVICINDWILMAEEKERKTYLCDKIFTHVKIE